MGTSVKKYH